MKKIRPAQTIILKSPREIEKLRAVNQIVATVLHELRGYIEPGISTGELDRIADGRLRFYGAGAAFKGYHGYPATACISINNEVVHGIPSNNRILNEGDLVSIDLGAVREGYFGDAAISLLVCDGPDVAKKLLEVTSSALVSGIAEASAGANLGDISSAIQRFVESKGFSVVRKFVGHGIGRALHEPPEVPNYGKRGCGPVLKPGMVLAIEPMVNAGGYDVQILDDGWTVVTADGSISAHFEHTVAITQHGPDILSELK
ncbi:MAG: type I methionyl aminopeptidase [Desulfobacteraceae bacterium]|nr:type I methionyl aminopeptidase [Desulfobacteraceae bacterium]